MALGNVEAIIFDWQGVLYQDSLNDKLVNWINNNQNQFQFAILTNNRGDFSRRLQQLEIDHLFSVVANPNNINYSKPDPKAFLTVLDKLAISPESAVFIDDNLMHIKNAKRLNIQTCLYQNNKQVLEEINSLI